MMDEHFGSWNIRQEKIKFKKRNDDPDDERFVKLKQE